MNNEITLSGSDSIEVDEIDLVEGGKFYIGGEVIPMRVLATNSDGQLYYSQNDFIESTIFNENHTQEIDCEISRINVIGDLNVNKNNPIQVSGTKPINTFLGINNDNEFGYYPVNFTPAKIQFTNSLGEIVSKVECFGDTGIVCDGWVKFHTLTPFYLHDEPLGLPNQVLAIGSNGLMEWSFVENPNIPITADLDINSLIVEGLVPNIPSYGVIIKNGLRVDGLATFKGVLGVVIDNDLLVQGTIKVMENLDCRASVQLHDNLYMTSASNISIGGDIGSSNEVIGKDINNNLKWLDAGDIIPNDADLVINSLIVEGLVPSITGYGVIIEKGLDVKEDINCNGAVNIGGSLSFPKSNSSVSILGDTGSINEVIGKDANNNLKWIHIGSNGLADGLNIDGAKLDLGIIATKQDLIDLNNIKMNDTEPRFFVGANFGAGVSPAVLGSRANSGLLEWMNLTGASHTNPIFRAGVNINTADMLDGQISVDYFPVFGGIHLNGSGAGYSGAVLELNSVIGIRQGKIQGSPIEDVNTTPITEWVEPIVNVFWATTGSGLRIDLNTIINARSATDIVVANTMTTEDAGKCILFFRK